MWVSNLNIWCICHISSLLKIKNETANWCPRLWAFNKIKIIKTQLFFFSYTNFILSANQGKHNKNTLKLCAKCSWSIAGLNSKTHNPRLHVFIPSVDFPIDTIPNRRISRRHSPDLTAAPEGCIPGPGPRGTSAMYLSRENDVRETVAVGIKSFGRHAFGIKT